MALTLHGTVSDNTVALDRPRVQPIIINGDMAVAQRGTQTGKTDGCYTATDRFYFNSINMGTWTLSQSTENPGFGFAHSLKWDCTSADGGVGAGDNNYLSVQTEGRNLQGLQKGTSNAKTSTVAFWIKCNKTGNIVCELWDRTNDRHVGQVVSISSANTWEKKIVNFPADTSGAIASDNARSIMISWSFGAGSDFTSGTLPSAWASRVDANRFVGTTLGLPESTDNVVYITGVQWEIGTFDANSIPPFQFEDASASLNRCMRYYERSQGTGSNREYFSVGIKRDSYSGSDTTVSGIMTYKVRKRATPTIGYNGATSFVYTHGVSSETNFSSINVQNIGLDHARFHGELSSTTANSGGIIARREETDRYYDIDSEL